MNKKCLKHSGPYPSFQLFEVILQFTKGFQSSQSHEAFMISRSICLFVDENVLSFKFFKRICYRKSFILSYLYLE